MVTVLFALTLFCSALLLFTVQPLLGKLLLPFLAVGVPFAVLSATAPLLQRWYATLEAADRDPYFLYAASNAGSLIGLLGYPFLIEPNLSLTAQKALWTAGVLFCLVLLA